MLDVTRDAIRQDPRQVQLRQGPPVELVVPSGSAAVYGRVLERGTKRPIAARPIFVSGRDGVGSLGQALTDMDGGYEVSGLPAGPVRVTFELRGDAEICERDQRISESTTT